ncbi:MAG: hypothetical protein ACD_72C00484G0002 [uncultured bacterium]|nr:MAG: hypothetical protein ACD_72C00484G0002 [uncultured bacterium]
MSQNWKIVLAVFITAIVVGRGVYFWQSSKPQYPEVVILPPTEQSDTEKSLTAVNKDTQPQTVENTSSTKTYKSNLYGYSFSYPAQYKNNNITLQNVGMEEISNGNELWGVWISTPLEQFTVTDRLNFKIIVLTPNEKLASTLSDNISNEKAIEIQKNTPKKYTSRDVAKFANDAYAANLAQLKTEADKEQFSRSIDTISLKENILTGNEIYTYRYNGEKVIFATDGYNIYEIVYTYDNYFSQGILDSLKFRK